MKKLSPPSYLREPFVTFKPSQHFFKSVKYAPPYAVLVLPSYLTCAISRDLLNKLNTFEKGLHPIEKNSLGLSIILNQKYLKYNKNWQSN